MTTEAEAQTQAPPTAGTFCWNEVLTTDTAAAGPFYSGLFGWESREMDMGPAGTYTIFANNGKDCCGMMKNPQEGIPSHWLSYIAVDDVDASTSKAESLGAQVYVPPTDIPNIGRFSVVADPTGAVFGLYKGTQC